MKSKIHSSIPARSFAAFDSFDVADYAELGEKLGIHLDNRTISNMMAYAMDELQPLVTTASVSTPVQFLQEWLPGFVKVITAARNIDEFIGLDIVGSWEDEQVVQGIVELAGNALPYGDSTNVPLASWNTNYNYRTVVRFEQGMMVDRLEEARSAKQRIDSAGEKRESCALQLEIERNRVGFFGYNNGANQTYGFLNDPNLGAYIPVLPGVAGTEWSVKTFLEITRDIRTAIVALRTQSQDNINPEKVNLTLAVATNSVDWLSTTSDFGISVRDWLTKAYPNVRVVSAPELNQANGGQNVFYLYADAIADRSTDNGKTFIQPVPAKYKTLGVQQLAKGYLEDYSNATSGSMCKRPWAVVRFTDI